jgi:hypothetical protein
MVGTYALDLGRISLDTGGSGKSGEEKFVFINAETVNMNRRHFKRTIIHVSMKRTRKLRLKEFLHLA